MCPVFIENISPDSKIKLLSLKKLAQKILRDFKERGDLNIILVSDGYMKKLNQRFTRRKGTTDVLSFSFREKDTLKGKSTFLGEVYISADKARKQAEDYQVPFEQELKRLVAHGVLHLLGCEHKNKIDEERMRKKEEGYIFS
ncbi:MAG: rRNA maturation RNase YbeY [candidate division Zixibacteria bacterium]|nr:rRNA maturation RNase YbeY [candidate division Zixibacteria bacterium]